MAPSRSDLAGRFEQLAMPHRNAAFNLAYRMYWRNREEAEDVVQDADRRGFPRLLRIQRRGHQAMAAGDRAQHTAYSALMARKRASSLILLADDAQPVKDGAALETACAGPSPEALVIAASERQQPLAALAQLPLKYRDIVVLREMEGLSYADIAEVTGTCIGTVMSRLSRGRAILRKALIAAIGTEPDAV